MIIDKYSRFCEKTAVTAAGAIGDIIDNKVDHNIGYGNTPVLHITATSDIASTAGITISLMASKTLLSGELGADAIEIVTTPAIKSASEGDVLWSGNLPKVPQAFRYLGLKVTGTATSGNINADILYHAPGHHIYPKD